MRRNQWTIGLTGPERLRGWIFFALYVIAFPFLMAWVQRSFPTEWPVAEANVVYYLLVAVLLFLLLWSFLRENFSLLLDWLPENLFALATGLFGAAVLQLLAMLIPYPVDNPNTASYAAEYMLAPQATLVILVILMPLVEEVLFRGLLFGCVRGYSRPLAWVLSVVLYCVYCVWQFTFAYGTFDLRYLALMAQYLPMAAALTWCYDMGGSIWTPVLLHAAINGFTLYSAIH